MQVRFLGCAQLCGSCRRAHNSGSSESLGSRRCGVGGEDSGSWRAGLRQVGEGQERRSLEPGRPRGVQGTQAWQQLGLNLVLVSLRRITSLNENSVLGGRQLQPLEGLRIQSQHEVATTDRQEAFQRARAALLRPLGFSGRPSWLPPAAPHPHALQPASQAEAELSKAFRTRVPQTCPPALQPAPQPHVCSCPLSTDRPRGGRQLEEAQPRSLGVPASFLWSCWGQFRLPAPFCHRFCSSGPRPPCKSCCQRQVSAPFTEGAPQAPAWPAHPPPGPGSPRGQAHCCFHGDACTLTSAFLHPWPNKEGLQVKTSSLKPPLLPCPPWPCLQQRGERRPRPPAQGKPRPSSGGGGLPAPALPAAPSQS